MEWPGIATAVGIILILTLILVGWRDDFHLKDWQPLIAAFVALAGGALAYRGAMAKVEQDADKNKRELLRRQLGLYLKLDITVRNFRDAAEGAGSKITFGEAGDRIRVGDMRLKEPPEIEEAWDNLDIFPRRIIREIASLRESLRELNLILFNLQDEDKLVVKMLAPPSIILARLSARSPTRALLSPMFLRQRLSNWHRPCPLTRGWWSSTASHLHPTERTP